MERLAKPRGCTNLKLRQLTRTTTREYDRRVGEVGLKNTQYALLSYVVKLGPVRPSDLARGLRMDPSTLTRNLRPMVGHGWLTISAGEDDRSRLVEATDAGRAKRAEGQRAWKEAQLALNARLGIERVVALHELLDACMACFDDAEDNARLTTESGRGPRVRK